MLASSKAPSTTPQIEPRPPTMTIERTKIEKPNWNSSASISVV